MAGEDATRIAELFIWMAAGAALIWLAVIGVAVYATRVRTGAHNPRIARLLIIGAGAVLPVLVLGILLAYGLWLVPELRRPAPANAVKVEVVGEQWWWRVRYARPDGSTVELANEIRLPRGRAAEFRLLSADVIHSFWIPPLGGKVDMIPGRVTRMIVEPTRTGVFRGACAEYCGTSHALMNLAVVVMEEQAFRRWLEHQFADAPAPASETTRRGQALFLANGCGACHTVRGTAADGVVGPDLTHVGGRLTIGAGILPTEPAAFARWIGQTRRIKPAARMPAFHMLPPDELQAMGAWLESLQ